ncbi:hypothetical protein V499_01797 [Pseudogymnoascus sp. VKM F-103]|nr:hypothetical protein V499_01797 [Pseudogymnoascus sp. VKM F-103]
MNLQTHQFRSSAPSEKSPSRRHGRQPSSETSLQSVSKRSRSYSTIVADNVPSDALGALQAKLSLRRGSLDVLSIKPRTFLIPVQPTLRALLQREDTDNNLQITIEDKGPKVLSVGTASSGGNKKFHLRGTYVLSNLLQELSLASELDKSHVIIPETRLNENPVSRLSRIIKYSYWDRLTRRIDANNIEIVGRDPKDWTDDPRPRIYVPWGAPEQYEYYQEVARNRPEIRLDVRRLPEGPINPEYARDMDIAAPGLLALGLEEYVDEFGKISKRGLPFVVPGGRFNELYGWDSYFILLGLLSNGRTDLAKSIVSNFCYSIKHYGKIHNANRSYYITRSQPPFLTDMAIQVYDHIRDESGALDFLRQAVLASIKEYYGIWVALPRLDHVTRLSRYRSDGIGIPPETEASHFTQILKPYALKHNLSVPEFIKAYNLCQITEPELDEYLLHDRALRESGHDTTYRFEGVCANLATVDLNSLLYKYETDISRIIRDNFQDNLEIPREFRICEMQVGNESSAVWDRRAKLRKRMMDKYLWNAKENMYFDYDTINKKQMLYESVTTFWPMWAGVASPQQSSLLMRHALPKFEVQGGLVSGTEKSRGKITQIRPNRQWDYPYGWAPHQMLAWKGLLRYGYQEEAERLAYKWLWMMTKAFVEYNGVVVEKYDVTRPIGPHKVDAEYGNQGANFQGVSREGFGWANASYVYGLQNLNTHMKRGLGACVPYETFKRAT